MPIPAGGEQMHKHITAGTIEAGELADLFSAAGLQRPKLAHLDESYVRQWQAAGGAEPSAGR